jgi:lysozyme family protein
MALPKIRDFRHCVDYLIDNLEGGGKLVVDTGGLTRFGISSRSHPGLDISSLTHEQAVEIYKREYWDRCRCGDFAWPMNLIVFDAAVNQGTEFAMTLPLAGPDYVEALMLRIVRYAETRNNNPHKYSPFFAGWVNRVIGIYEMVQKA